MWKKITRTLSREGWGPRVYRLFFKTMVQGVLLFGLETWAFTPCMGRSYRRKTTVWRWSETFLDEGGVEEDHKNPHQGGVGAAGVWIILLNHGTVSVDIRLGDLGGHPPYGKVPEGGSSTRW